MEERCILVHPNDEAYGDASKKECTSPPLPLPSEPRGACLAHLARAAARLVAGLCPGAAPDGY